ncbi:MAG: flagellar hook-basal body complex protein FliE [Gammaproteobacteria bacterium]|nr:flagellar hook-basal body complex protein FliE [Gammaproteobacteria bacterium]
MSAIDTQRLLMEMRDVAQQAQLGGNAGIQPALDIAGTDGLVDASGASTDFAGLMRQAIDKVNEQGQTSNQLKERMEMGDPNVELSEVMIQAQKASLAFQAMTQVRNKLVEAYKDVMSMPI